MCTISLCASLGFTNVHKLTHVLAPQNNCVIIPSFSEHLMYWSLATVCIYSIMFLTFISFCSFWIGFQKWNFVLALYYYNAYVHVYRFWTIQSCLGKCATAKKQSSLSPEWQSHSEHSLQNQLVFVLTFLVFLQWEVTKSLSGSGRMADDDVRLCLQRLQ